MVTGKVEVVCEKEGEQHTGLTLGVEGLVSLDQGGMRLGSAARTTQNLVQTHQLAPSGKLYATPSPPLCFLCPLPTSFCPAQ